MKKRLVLVMITILLLAVTAGCTSFPDASKPESDLPVPEDTYAIDSEYDGGLFDPSRVHTIDIEMAAEDWNDLLENPLEKSKYHCDITIDGEKVNDVSCSTKGNSSLIMVKDLYGIDRYSLKINFGKYVEGQKFHGLSKINLNNSFSDSTYLKDYLCYRMFNKAGVDAPLCSFSWVRVNGEDYGLFITVEEVDENFLERTGWKDSVLYKPDNDKLAADSDVLNEIIVGGFQVEDYSEGAELKYRGENIEDYPDIFENAQTEAEDEDKLRVIRALKSLSEGEDLEKYLYTDELLKYFAVQNFVMNYDGYTGPMLHNYYLCEKDGKLAMFPWDYNSAFATAWARKNKAESDATLLVNYGIDTPLLGTTVEQRPMWKWIIENDLYKQGYHEAMDEFLKTYFESGRFEKEIDEIVELIKPYVEKDPTALYGAKRFSLSAKALKTFILLRTESVRKQLDSDLSTVTEKQSSADKVDASEITIDQLQ